MVARLYNSAGIGQSAALFKNTKERARSKLYPREAYVDVTGQNLGQNKEGNRVLQDGPGVTAGDGPARSNLSENRCGVYNHYITPLLIKSMEVQKGIHKFPDIVFGEETEGC